MEYLLLDAGRRKADTLITCGGEQSNHARTVAAVAARAGLHCVLVLWGSPRKNVRGNLLLDAFLGARIVFVDRKAFDRSGEIMESIAEDLRRDGYTPYIIPEGGTSPLGIFGYVEAAREINIQIRDRALDVDFIVTAVGSGGTLAGLAIGKKIFRLPQELIGINVLYDGDHSAERILRVANECCRLHDIPAEVERNDFRILDGYSSEGYKRISRNKMIFLKGIARQTGIVFDPTYTGKALYGIMDWLDRTPGMKTKRILFLHTGGIFSVFAKETEYGLK